jgi:hypothetical protein
MRQFAATPLEVESASALDPPARFRGSNLASVSTGN